MKMGIGAKMTFIMKRTFRTLAATLTMIAGLYACSVEYPDRGMDGIPEEGVFVRATTDCATKATLSGNDDNGYNVVWQNGDAITIGGRKFNLKSGAGSKDGLFQLASGTAPGQGTYDAFYPASYTGSGWVYEQQYVANNITGLPMKAVATVSEAGALSDLNFYNQGGIFRVNVKGSSSIKVKTITITANELSKPITLTCTTPVELSGSGVQFHIALPKNEYTGVCIKFKDNNGNFIDYKTLQSGKKLSIKCNCITRASFELSNGPLLNVATYNVDGLPVSIQLGDMAGELISTLNISGAKVEKKNGDYYLYINDDGPGSEGSKTIGSKIAGKNWDVIGLNEDFNYHEEIKSSLSNYTFGTWQKGFPTALTTLGEYLKLYVKYDNNEPLYEIDGLGIGVKKDCCSLSGEAITSWNSNATYGYLDHSSDQLTQKGFRFYTVTVTKSGLTAKIDFIVLHADAGGGDEDKAARENAYAQLVSYIQKVKTGNPMILMGDFNTEYTRDKFKTLFIDKLNAISGVKASDAWVEFNNGGVYPTSNQGGSAQSKEKLDKIVFLNRASAPIELKLFYQGNVTTFTDSGGQLSDHMPVEATFRIVERKK